MTVKFFKPEITKMENKVENENSVPPVSAGVAMFGDSFAVPDKAGAVTPTATL